MNRNFVKQTRGRWQFGLRALLLVITLVGACCDWGGWEWRKQELLSHYSQEWDAAVAAKDFLKAKEIGIKAHDLAPRNDLANFMLINSDLLIEVHQLQQRPTPRRRSGRTLQRRVEEIQGTTTSY